MIAVLLLNVPNVLHVLNVLHVTSSRPMSWPRRAGQTVDAVATWSRCEPSRQPSDSTSRASESVPATEDAACQTPLLVVVVVAVAVVVVVVVAVVAALATIAVRKTIEF
jgi:hypothetical protein